MAITNAARAELRRLVDLAIGEFNRIGDTAAATTLEDLRNLTNGSLDTDQATMDALEQAQHAAWRTADHSNWMQAQDAVWGRLNGLATPVDWVAVLHDPDRRASRALKTLLRGVCLRATRHVTDGGAA